MVGPYYSAQDPTPRLSAPGLPDPAKLSRFFGSLPGVRQFAGWVANEVSAGTGNLVRQTFRILGIDPVTTGSGQDPPADESVTPGYFAWWVRDPAASTVKAGELWVTYHYHLIGPRAPEVSSLGLYSTSTDSSALALESALVNGNRSLYSLNGNTIKFLSPGYKTVIIKWEGTSIVPDEDGHTLTDDYQVDVTSSRMGVGYDVSSSAYVAMSNSASQAIYLSASGSGFQVMFFYAQLNDTLTIDALTSGTLAKTIIHVINDAPSTILRT
jgi:hypothetical protein